VERSSEKWHQVLEVYHTNVSALREPWEAPPVYWTTAARSWLASSSVFQPVENDAAAEGKGIGALPAVKWAPRCADVKRSLEEAPEGTAAWALKKGFIGFVYSAFRADLLSTMLRKGIGFVLYRQICAKLRA
jgi:hypothetical protein